MNRKPITVELIHGGPDGVGENPHINKIYELFQKYEVKLDAESLIAAYVDNPAPASAGHHLNIIWGLWEHINNVMKWALMLNAELDTPYPVDVVVKVVISHDLSKFEDAPFPASMKRDGNFRDKFWEYNNSDIYEGHEDFSLIIGMKYFSFDKLERNAIKYHHGPYSNDMKTDQYMKKEVMSGLAYLLHISDNLCASIVETSYFAPRE